jgi:hypothetical protein
LQEFIFVLTHYEKNVLTTIDFTSDHALSLSVASSIAMSKYPKNYASARGGTGQGGGNATNAATTKGASGGAFAVKRRNKF